MKVILILSTGFLNKITNLTLNRTDVLSLTLVLIRRCKTLVLNEIKIVLFIWYVIVNKIQNLTLNKTDILSLISILICYWKTQVDPSDA